jgi:hypothetical protein
MGLYHFSTGQWVRRLAASSLPCLVFSGLFIFAITYAEGEHVSFSCLGDADDSLPIIDDAEVHPIRKDILVVLAELAGLPLLLDAILRLKHTGEPRGPRLRPRQRFDHLPHLCHAHDADKHLPAALIQLLLGISNTTTYRYVRPEQKQSLPGSAAGT